MLSSYMCKIVLTLKINDNANSSVWYKKIEFSNKMKFFPEIIEKSFHFAIILTKDTFHT